MIVPYSPVAQTDHAILAQLVIRACFRFVVRARLHETYVFLRVVHVEGTFSASSIRAA